MKRLLAGLLLLAASLVASAAEAPLPAPPERWATDEAGLLSAMGSLVPARAALRVDPVQILKDE